jgi:hypothetical protein
MSRATINSVHHWRFDGCHTGGIVATHSGKCKRTRANHATQEYGLRIAFDDVMTPPLAPAVDLHSSETSRSHSESMCELASLLLDWRVECERHLRALTSIQRWLERVRCGAAADGERELLLQEIGRLLREPAPDHDSWTRCAETYLNNLSRGGPCQSVAPPNGN